MVNRLIVSCMMLCFMVQGCRSYTKITPIQRSEITKKYAGTIVALKLSCFYGDLYDDNDYVMLTQWDFSDTAFIQDLHGQPIHPKNQRGIIPIGTKFEIVDIEFPDKSAMLKRMLTTPRYNPWVKLRIIDRDPFLPGAEKPFVIVLPPQMESTKQVQAAINLFLGNPQEIHQWMSKRNLHVLNAIKHKEIVKAMSYDEIIAAKGYPLEVEIKGDKKQKQVRYPHQSFLLVEDRLTESSLPPSKK